MPLRKFIFWLHLSAGLLAGLVILVMSVTGILLAFERQILAAAESNLRAVESDAAAQPLPLSVLVKGAGPKASNVTLRADRRAPVAVAVGREKTIFIDRYTGKILGEGSTGLRHFFRGVEDLHRWLALQGDARERGKAITGAANVVFLFIVVTGPYIWIPRNRAALRGLLWFRRGLAGRRRDLNWHNVLGIWSFVPLLLIVFSGVVLSYRLFSSAQQPQQRATKKGLDLAALDPLFAVAARQAPQWRSLSARLPIPEEGPVTISIDEGNGARPDKRSQLILDGRTGSVIEHKTYSAQKAAQKTRGWLRFIHTGEAGGIAGQFIAMLACAAATVLVWTGLSLAIRRYLNWKNRKETSAGPPVGDPAVRR